MSNEITYLKWLLFQRPGKLGKCCWETSKTVLHRNKTSSKKNSCHQAVDLIAVGFKSAHRNIRVLKVLESWEPSKKRSIAQEATESERRKRVAAAGAKVPAEKPAP